MSLQLGPIHHWIHRQIGLVVERGERLASGLEAEFGSDARKAWREILQRHAGEFGDRPLEELIDGDIHGSLDGMIAVVQAREAELVAWVTARDAVGGPEILARIFSEDGRSWGQRARAVVAGGDARGIFAALRELWLEGMPCDLRMETLEESPAKLRWRRRGQPLARYWAGSGADPRALKDLHALWQRAFVSAWGEDWVFEAESSEAEGDFDFSIARREKEEH
jgi:hypothetical protein